MSAGDGRVGVPAPRSRVGAARLLALLVLGCFANVAGVACEATALQCDLMYVAPAYAEVRLTDESNGEPLCGTLAVVCEGAKGSSEQMPGPDGGACGPFLVLVDRNARGVFPVSCTLTASAPMHEDVVVARTYSAGRNECDGAIVPYPPPAETLALPVSD
jgi:hypothetical protein